MHVSTRVRGFHLVFPCFVLTPSKQAIRCDAKVHVNDGQISDPQPRVRFLDEKVDWANFAETAKLLVDHRADVNGVDESGRTMFNLGKFGLILKV